MQTLDWLKENWIPIVGISVWLTGMVIIFFSLQNQDPDLSRTRSHEVAREFETEIKGITIPLRTGLNKFESIVESGSDILVTQVYRTELSDDEFFNSMNEQLVQRRWTLYRRTTESAFTTLKYCRGNFDASLSRKGGGGIWADGATYWHLSMSLGLRVTPLFGSEPMPRSCEAAS